MNDVMYIPLVGGDSEGEFSFLKYLSSDSILLAAWLG